MSKVAPKLGTGSQAEAIPFRQTSAVSGPEVFGTLLITLLTLSAFAALAWYARRRGWLNRWMSPAAIAGDATRKLAVVEVLRVSSKTTIYRVRDGDRELILTESQAQIHVIPATTEVDQ